MRSASRWLVLLRKYREWVIAAPILLLSFYLQGKYDKPTPTVGLIWFGAILAYWGVVAIGAYRRERDDPTLTTSSTIPPLLFQSIVEATRADKAVREEFPDDVERVIFFGGPDGKPAELTVGVFLKGEMGKKLAAAFPGDPAGAWMFTERERNKMSQMRSTIWSHAMAVDDARVQPPVFFESTERLPSYADTPQTP